MSNLSYCDTDLAKNHFSVHATNKHGKVILHKNVTRSKFFNTIAKMPRAANRSYNALLYF